MPEENYQGFPLDEKHLDKIYKEVNKPENSEIINLILENVDVEKETVQEISETEIGDILDGLEEISAISYRDHEYGEERGQTLELFDVKIIFWTKEALEFDEKDEYIRFVNRKMEDAAAAYSG